MRIKRRDYLSANVVEELFKKLPVESKKRIGQKINSWSHAYHLTYTNDQGKTALITLTLRPRLIDKKSRNAFWRVIQILDGAFKKIGRIYAQDPDINALFPFSQRESDWIAIMSHPQYQPGQIASRWDSNTTFGNKDWKNGSSFFEVNGVGVGGMWYGPACAELTLKKIVPEFQKVDSAFRPFFDHDMRRLLLGLLLNQRKKIGRTKGAMALVMEKASGSNFVEFECLAKLYRQLGYRTIVAEPTDFVLKGNAIVCRGQEIDILYRDTTLSELCLLEEQGHDMSALREAFRRGQIVSSLEGEFDHKSVFEVFTDPQFLKYFSAEEKQVFKKFVLWTRLLREIRTTDPKGKSVDLISFVLKHPSQLVLKPNRLYGGKGILFGRDLTSGKWAKKIEACLAEPGDWVVQQLGEFRTKKFYRPDKKGIAEKDLYVVSGFFATDKGLGVVGRMSELTVVNVARRGGLTPILLI